MTTSTSSIKVSSRNNFSLSFKFLGILLFVLLVSGKMVGQATYTLCTSTADLVSGSKYIIVSSQTTGTAYPMGYQNTNNRPQATAVTIASSAISTTVATASGDLTKAYELTLGGSTGAWTLQDPLYTNYYLKATSSASNYLQTTTGSAVWTITFTSNAAIMTCTTGSFTRNVLQYNSPSSLYSCYTSGQSSVYLYKKAASAITSNAGGGAWGTGSTWVGGVAPTASDNVVIAGPVTAGALTRNAGTTTTINTGASLSMTGTYTNNGTTTVNGTFEIGSGSWATGNNLVYGSAGTLNMNSAVYAANSGTYWPATSGPVNVNILQSVTMGFARTVTGTLSVSAAVTNATTNTLTINGGTCQINNSSATFSDPLIYSGTTNLVYNVTGTIGRGNEWNNTYSPSNVTLQATTTLNYPNGWGAITRSLTGNLTIGTGTALYMDYGSPGTGVGALTVGGNVSLSGNLSLGNQAGGDLNVGGNWSNTGGTFAANGRAVTFNGTGAQSITNTAGETFAYLINNKASGTLTLANNVTVNAASSDVLQILNAGSFDLNGKTLTLSGAGGNIKVTGAARTISSGVAGALINISGAKTVTSATSGSLVIGTNITTVLTAGLDCGSALTTVNGTLQINSGGFITTNAPTYGSSSTLLYNSGTTYGRGIEWASPANVQLSNNTVLNYPNGATTTAKSITGNLTIDAGSALYMDYGTLGYTTGSLSVGGNLVMNGNLSLSDAIGGDLNVTGNWTKGAGTFNPNTRLVTFNSTTGTQTITGATTFDYLTCNNTSTGITLANAVTVNKTLTFTAGKVSLGANNLTVGSTGLISGGSATAYAVTSSTGLLIKQGVGNSAVTFPVGPSTSSYTPLAITNIIGTSDLSLTVKNSITNAVTDATKVVNVEWGVTSSGATTATIAPTWASGNQGGSMTNPGSGELGNYTSSYAITTGLSLTQYTTSATGVALQNGSNKIVVGNAGSINTPVISTSGTLSAVSTTYGTASASPTSFSVSGIAMTAGVLVTPPAGFEVSLSSGSGYNSTITVGAAGTIASTSVYVRLAATTAAGTYSGNIILTSAGATTKTVATVSSTVSTKALTISGLTGTNKIYDGSTSASFTGTPAYSGLQNGETYSVTGTPSASFATAAAGITKTITITGYNAPSSNYTVTATCTANITTKALTMSGLSVLSSKTYDGTTTAVVSGTPALQSAETVGAGNTGDGIPYTGDVVSITGTATGTYDDANVASATTVTFVGLSLTGAQAANYSLTIQSPQAATITKANQSITLASTDAKYIGDGDYTLAATSSTSSTNTLSYTSSSPTVASINSSTGLVHIGSVAGSTTFTVSQGANANYNAATDATQTLTITVAPSTIFSENMGTPSGTTTIATFSTGTAPATFQNKGTLTYGQGDQATPADLRATSASSGYTGASANGNVYFTSTSGAYGFSIEGINASTYSGLTLSYGYRKESASAHATFSVDYWNGSAWVTIANISGALFTESATATSTWYAAKTLSLPVGAQISGLKIRFVKTGTTAIRIDDVVLKGMPVPTITVTGGVLSAVNTTYGTASVTPTSFTASGTNLTADILITAPSGYEISKTSGGASGYATSQTLTQSGGSVSATTIYARLAATTSVGNSYNGNIQLTSTDASTVNVATATSTVSAKGLTVTSPAANNKPYDGNNTATITGTLSGIVGSDDVSLSGTGTFASTAVGTGIAVTSTSTLTGAQAGNYSLTQPTGLTADITSVSTTISSSGSIGSSSALPGTDLTVQSGVLLTVDNNTTVRSLTVNPGGKVSLVSGKTLTVSGAFTLQSSVSGTATFVDYNTDGGLTVTGTSTMQQYFGSARNWYISSPVSSATAQSGYTFYKRNEPTAAWVTMTTGDALNAGQGYIANLASGTATYTFTGTFNTGSVTTPSLSRSTGISKEGFNLIGNPYPSYLDISSLDTAKVVASYWVRSKNAGNTAYAFDTFNAKLGLGTSLSGKALTGIVPPMQAFWVRVKTGQSPATLTFDNSLRSHIDNINNVFRAPAQSYITQQVLRLQVTNGVNYDEAILAFNPKASNSLDDYDSPKMSNNSASMPEIYTIVSNEDLSINGMNSISYDTEMTLGFTTGQSGSFTLKASQFDNFASGTQIILRDKLMNYEQDLTISNYSFDSDITANNETRFSLVFKAPTVVSGINHNSNGNVWISINANNQIMVNGANGASYETSVAVYNAVGQQLVSQRLTSTTKSLGTFVPGVYMVTVSNAGKSATTKVIIK